MPSSLNGLEHLHRVGPKATAQCRQEQASPWHRSGMMTCRCEAGGQCVRTLPSSGAQVADVRRGIQLELDGTRHHALHTDRPRRPAMALRPAGVSGRIDGDCHVGVGAIPVGERPDGRPHARLRERRLPGVRAGRKGARPARVRRAARIREAVACPDRPHAGSSRQGRPGREGPLAPPADRGQGVGARGGHPGSLGCSGRHPRLCGGRGAEAGAGPEPRGSAVQGPLCRLPRRAGARRRRRGQGDGSASKQFPRPSAHAAAQRLRALQHDHAGSRGHPDAGFLRAV